MKNLIIKEGEVFNRPVWKLKDKETGSTILYEIQKVKCIESARWHARMVYGKGNFNIEIK